MQTHTTVLLKEAVVALQIQPTDTIVDATYGAGGHAEEILERLGSTGTCIAIDVDETAFLRKPRNPNQATIHLVNDNFRNITDILRSLYTTSVEGILADLGWRSEQFSVGDKGLSFMHDGPLLMTLGAASAYSFTAADIVNEWAEETLADIIFGYGEERYARRIAKAIVSRRANKPITTTFELRDCIVAAVPASARHGKIHPATKTFQALRIAVNDELQALEAFIEAGFNALAPGGRLAIISFHSLEDRIVKHSFRALAQTGQGAVETKKPIEPSAEERASNPRARSAKLRVIEKYNNVEQHEQTKTHRKSITATSHSWHGNSE